MASSDRVISWEEYFMGVALLSAKRSKDPKTQVGACIVNKAKRIVGLGYNGFPDNIPDNDKELPWEKSSEKDADGNAENKHLYVCHAEMNAIVNKMSMDISGCTMYTTLFPCNECAKLICQSRLGKVVYLEKRDEETYRAAEKMFTLVKQRIKTEKPSSILIEKYKPTPRKIELDV